MPPLTYARRSRGTNGPARGRPARYPTGSVSTNPLTSFGLTYTAAFWAEDPLWTAPADGGAVSSWRDAGSENKPATQGAGAKQPVYRASVAALNGRPAIQGDGADDFLQTADWSAPLTQPWVSIMVGSMGASAETLMDGNDGTNRGLLWWNNTGGKFNFNNGTSLNTTVDGDTTPRVFSIVANGASSVYVVGSTTVSSVNAGTASLDGLTFLANNAGSAATCNSGYIAFAAIMTGAEYLAKGTEVSNLAAWLRYYYGVA